MRFRRKSSPRGLRSFRKRCSDAAANRLQWNDAIAAAFKFSLLERNPADKTISVHRMVQAVAKAGMKPEERAQWAERVVGAVNAAFPTLSSRIGALTTGCCRTPRSAPL